ncbi:MAG TPA: acyl-ACP--UDP-N-acetylglucosamine O-acyltransferase [Terriglobales bacterium]|nr:acyl-ACP--UDP-N-acetylglucosamine O-acyltransferase [Terriglobales bacterium]
MSTHPTATVDPSAKVPASCKIGPYCTIGPNVELGDNCELVSHVSIHGPTKIGSNNRFFPFCAIGGEPQDISYKGEPTRLEIGDSNVIREFVTINRGTMKGGALTRIGSYTLIMAYSHIGHDCIIGDHAMLVNAATLAGHVEVGDWAVVGALNAVHQFVRIGAHAYIGGGTIVTQDVLPFSLTSSKRDVQAFGINKIGLQRRGFSEERISKLQQAYRTLLKSRLNTSQAVEKIKSEELSEDVQYLVDFVSKSERGIIK